jgi:hypothetical protein
LKERSMKISPTALRLALTLGLAFGLAASAHAQRVVRDAVTGQMRAPTATEAKQLDDLERAMRHRIPRGLLSGKPNPQPVRMPDGSDFLESTDADLNYSVVVRASDGRLVRHCVSSPEMAERIGRGQLTAFTGNFMERLNER